MAMAKVSFDRSIRDQTDRWMDRCGNIFIVPGLLLLCTKTMSRYVSIVLFNCQKKSIVLFTIAKKSEKNRHFRFLTILNSHLNLCS